MANLRVGMTVSQNIDPFLGRLFNGTARFYAEGVLKAGGLPVLLPVLSGTAKSQVAHLDAVLFTGGVDIHPWYFGEDARHGLGEVDPERDAFEAELYQAAKEKSLPMLGICRGMQIINVFEGGTLYQDLPQHSQFWADHSQKAKPPVLAHKVRVISGTALAQYHPELELQVNSHHHQGIKDLAPTLNATAYSPDGLIEAYEGEGIAAVQWHPELLFAKYPEHLSPFQMLLNMVKEQV